MPATLTFGFSPCPNDTFAFHALVHGLIEAPFTVAPVLLDIETLNQRAHHGAFDLTKLSVGAFAAVGDRYRLLRSGGALGHGVGPLVVARSPRTLADIARGSIAIPGRETTAYRLLRLAVPDLSNVLELRYDQILGAVARGDVDTGLIIHESRFTYAEHGLVTVVDLGDWWEAETSLPVPLAGICARRDLDPAVAGAAEAAIRASVAYAFAHPEASRAYVRQHSQEMSDAVCDAHIRLYVNAHSLDIGDDGLRAVARLAGTTAGALTPTFPSRDGSSINTCWTLSQRNRFDIVMLAHNVPFTLLGTGLLWFGWFGFNAGSALAAKNPTVRVILQAARTGEVGDGKVMVLPIEKIYRIRTGEEDQAAVTPLPVPPSD